MDLTNAQQNEIHYGEHQISLKRAKILEMETAAEILLTKVDSQNSAREYLIQGEKIGVLKKEIEDFEARIREIKNVE